MADGGEIKGQAEACGAELHNLRPAAMLPQKGKERGKSLPHHCGQGKGRTGGRTASSARTPLLVGGHKKGSTLKLA